MENNSDRFEMLNNQEVKSNGSAFWVFGYGSLCWNPGFEYQKSMTGYVRGFSRRFWQGNTTHRGTETKPGRVATLIEDSDGITWGRAFLVAADNRAAMPYLNGRECRLGGYRTCRVSFHPRKSTPVPHTSASTDLTTLCGTSNMAEDPRAFLYVAVPENHLWLGAAPLPEIAKQIVECRGPSGTNAEYLLRLADFMRQEIPEALDDHLFSLERLVRKFAAEMKLCLRTLMGESNMEAAEKLENQQNVQRNPPAPSFQFASRIPDKKLRCVRM